MRRIYLFIFLLLINASAMADTRLMAAEYFIDVDPGEGNGISIMCTDGNFDQAIEGLLAGGITISSGTHSIGVRVKALNGQWSPVFRTIITSVNNTVPNITLAEFFLGTDPGTGNGTPMIAFDGNFDQSFETVIASGISVAPGSYKINVRVRGSNGQWSPVFSTVISSNSLREIHIISAEYFLDQDPGIGNGSPLLAFDGNFNEAIETIVQSGIAVPAGSHVFNVRVKDKMNNWSPVFKTVIHSQSLRELNIVQAEAFTDPDPGQGNGTPLLALDGNLNSVLESLYTTAFTGQLPNGNFKMNVRVKDKENHWSPVFSTVISVLSMRDIRISQAEVFVDNDPGIGSGIPLIAFDGQFEEAVETVTGSLPSLATGAHTLNIRCRDAKNIWSPVFTSAISPNSVREIRILQAEYFWDTDPGEGNGNALLTFDGTFDQALEQLFTQVQPLRGSHKFSVRIKQAQTGWSPPFSMVISNINNTAGILYVKLFLQGFYRGNGQMVAVADPILKPMVCDTISMSLVSALSPYQIVHSDTTILSTTGDAYFSLPELVFNNDYYIVLNHHNSLQTWSGIPVRFSMDTVAYDFTHAASSAYGDNLYSFPDGRTAIFTGDITGDNGSQDGSIDLNDFYLLQSDLMVFISGYHKDDLNGDHLIESADFSFLENNVEQGITVLRP